LGGAAVPSRRRERISPSARPDDLHRRRPGPVRTCKVSRPSRFTCSIEFDYLVFSRSFSGRPPHFGRAAVADLTGFCSSGPDWRSGRDGVSTPVLLPPGEHSPDGLTRDFLHRRPLAPSRRCKRTVAAFTSETERSSRAPFPYDGFLHLAGRSSKSTFF